MSELAKFVTAYKEQPPEIRKNLRRKAAYLSESPTRQMHERLFNGELLKAFERAEKEIAPAPPVQTVKIELPDIPAQTFVTLGKYGLLAGAVCVIGTVIVALIVETVAFIAAYGVYLVVAVVVVLLLKSLTWRGERDEYKEENPTNQQNIIINVTASNGGNVTVNKETT